MSDELDCPQETAGEHEWEVVSTSADNHLVRCRKCAREKAEAHRFVSWDVPGMDFYTVIATYLKCSVCGYETIL
jgi:hypothetical protein